MEFTKEDCKKILQDCGLHRIKAIELSGKLKDKLDEKLKVKVKKIIESKDISEPKSTYNKK